MKSVERMASVVHDAYLLAEAVAGARAQVQVLAGQRDELLEALTNLLAVAEQNTAGYVVETERWYAIRDAARAAIEDAGDVAP